MTDQATTFLISRLAYSRLVPFHRALREALDRVRGSWSWTIAGLTVVVEDQERADELASELAATDAISTGAVDVDQVGDRLVYRGAL